MTGYFFIKSKLSGFVLDIAGGEANPGTKVIVWSKDEAKDNQKWRFDADTGAIRSKLDDNIVIDIQGGEDVIVNTFQLGKTEQRWQRANGDRLLNIDNPANCIDVFESDDTEGARVITYPFYGTENQFWEFEEIQPPPPPIKYFYITSQLNQFVATVKPGTNLLISYPKGDTQIPEQLFFEDDDGNLHNANGLAFFAGRGDQISLQAVSDSPNAFWRFDGINVKNGDGYVLDIAGASPEPGVSLVAWDKIGAQINQCWNKDYV